MVNSELHMQHGVNEWVDDISRDGPAWITCGWSSMKNRHSRSSEFMTSVPIAEVLSFTCLVFSLSGLQLSNISLIFLILILSLLFLINAFLSYVRILT